jgi:hypothetical protein
MKERDFSVLSVDGPKIRENNRMITAEADRPCACFMDFSDAFFDRAQGRLKIDRVHPDISAVNDVEPLVYPDAEAGVVVAVHAGSVANRSGAEACAWPVGSPSIEGDSQDGHIDIFSF